MRSTYCTKAVFTILLFAAAICPAQGAFLTGNTVRIDYLFPTVADSVGNSSAVVNSAVEFSNAFNFGYFNIDVTDTGFQISFLDTLAGGSPAFNGIRLSDIQSTIGAFTSVVINPTSTLTGFGSSNVTFDADNVFVNLSGLNPVQGNLIALDINPSNLPPAAIDIPEPASFITALSALGVVLFARRRRS